MAEEHDYKEFPELTNKQLETMQFQSPHEQIIADFVATVVKVHDGDTITLFTEFRDFSFPLRFIGIDAPELNVEGGKDIQIWLQNRILGKKVDILIDKNNRVEKFGRLLGGVFNNGMNVGDEMLRNGLVVPFDQRKETEFPVVEKMLDIKQWL